MWKNATDLNNELNLSLILIIWLDDKLNQIIQIHIPTHKIQHSMYQISNESYLSLYLFFLYYEGSALCADVYVTAHCI